jgi:hypothetical protein
MGFEVSACRRPNYVVRKYPSLVPDDDAFQAMKSRLAGLLPRLNERDRRLALATEARSWGRGGIVAVHRATGASRSTIRRGLRELENDPARQADRVRAPGGGRKKAEVADPDLLDRLDSLIEPGTRGDPESTPSHRCAGPRSRPANWPTSSPRWDTRSATRWSRRSCARPGTACRAPARPSKAPSTPTGTPSSATSTPPPHDSWPPASR